jgi:KDO2-lipid IV(A) lauroyltransferase
VAAGIARRLGPWTSPSRRAERNLRYVYPGIEPAEMARIIAGAWDNFARIGPDYWHLAEFRDPAAGRLEVVGGEHLDALRDDGRPGILFGGHLANWEMIALAARRHDLPLAVVYREFNNPLIDAYVRRIQRSSGVELIRKGRAGARRLQEVLRGGGHTMMLVDVRLNEGISVPFLGRPAMTPPALAHLALKFDAPIVPVRVERIDGARFRVTVHPPLEAPADDDRRAAAYAVMAQVNAHLEAWIRARPEQWLWFHQRWGKLR